MNVGEDSSLEGGMEGDAHHTLLPTKTGANREKPSTNLPLSSNQTRQPENKTQRTWSECANHLAKTDLSPAFFTCSCTGMGTPFYVTTQSTEGQPSRHVMGSP